MGYPQNAIHAPKRTAPEHRPRSCQYSVWQVCRSCHSRCVVCAGFRKVVGLAKGRQTPPSNLLTGLFLSRDSASDKIQSHLRRHCGCQWGEYIESRGRQPAEVRPPSFKHSRKLVRGAAKYQLCCIVGFDYPFDVCDGLAASSLDQCFRFGTPHEYYILDNFTSTKLQAALFSISIFPKRAQISIIEQKQ